jgi:hypothetical protein
VRGLHSQILRVNRLLYVEGLDVLYGENYFRMKIWAKYGQERASFLKCDHFAKHVHSLLPQYGRIQRYDIYVELQLDEEYFCVKATVRKVANTLSEIHTLKHMRITLGGHEEDNLPTPEEFRKYSHILQPFALLRNVGRWT